MRVVLDLQGCQTDSRYRGIGRYSLELAKAIAAKAGEHDVWILLSELLPESISSLQLTFERLLPSDRIVTFSAAAPVEAVDPINSWRCLAAEKLREAFLASLKPDLVHISSLFEGRANNAVTSVGRFVYLPTAVTLYDLIPFHDPDSCPTPQWYSRKLCDLASADILLAISESARREAIEALELPADRVINISGGVDPQFSPAALSTDEKDKLLARYGITRAFILYSGALEARKNVFGLLQAYASLPSSLRDTHQLVIIGKHHEDERNRLRTAAKTLSLRDNAIVFTGYVPDSDLIALYSTCQLFVLPSFYEGLGLPALEAMACGAPTIGSNRTSIPEAIGHEAALFDPSQPASITDRMVAALSDEAFRKKLRERGLRQVLSFTWDNTASLVWNAFEALDAKCKSISSISSAREKKLRLACVSPMLQMPHSSRLDGLLTFLADRYQLDLIATPLQIDSSWQGRRFSIQSRSHFESQADCYDRILYILGNSPLYHSSFELLTTYPGTVLLQDFSIIQLWDTICTDIPDGYELLQQIYNSHGYRSFVPDFTEGSDDSLASLPCNKTVIDSAAGVIVPSLDYFELADTYYGSGTSKDWVYIPFPRLGPGTGASEGEPFHAGDELCRTIERFGRSHPLYRERELLREIAAIDSPISSTEQDLATTAAAIASLRPSAGPRQLLVDVSGTAQFDAQTGIQRVTRHLTLELIKDPPPGYRIEPVQGWESSYTYARSFTLKMMGLEPFIPDSSIKFHRGDAFVGLDLSPPAVAKRAFFEELHARHIPVYFVVHDLLAIRRPDLFSSGMHEAVSRWLGDLSEIADGLVCVSRTVADDLLNWLDEEQPKRMRPLRIGYFHHGADINRGIATMGLSPKAESVLEAMRRRPSILMVGTIEPRKGHSLSLAAFERLWSENTEVNLVIAGQEGWHVQSLVMRLRSHPEAGRRLFWVEGPSDEMLLRIYQNAVALLAASEAEGFGLPLIEAAQHGLPIIARDIPVFREVAAEHAFYFPGKSSEDLAACLKQWLNLHRSGKAPASSGLPWLTWKQSAQQLMAVVLNQKIYRTWYPDGRTERQEESPQLSYSTSTS